MTAWLLALPLFLAATGAGSWSDLPPLPAATAGQMAGVSHGALVVVGGSNFDKPPYEGGIKHWLDTIFVLGRGKSKWKAFHAPGPIAYGGFVTWRDSLVIAGGSDGRTNFREVRQVEWAGGKISFKQLPPLPEPAANCGAARIGDRMFIFGGQASPAASSTASLWSLDLTKTESGWRILAPLPGPSRILPVFASAGNELYVFGGAELTPSGRRYLHDGWRWNAAKGWSAAVAPPFPMVAAPTVSTADGILVFSGDDGANAERAAELGGRHPGFGGDIWEFFPKANKWTNRGSVPVGLVTTAAVHWGGRIVIPGGEDRPGHRSARVLGWTPR